MQITLFESGKGIKEGDMFIATLDSVEGHGKVTLTLVEKVKDELEYCPLCYEKLDGVKTHGSWCK